jgi:hypothetical protein
MNTTAEMLEQIDIELFGHQIHVSKWINQIADEQEFIAELAEYERARTSSRTGVKGDRIA